MRRKTLGIVLAAVMVLTAGVASVSAVCRETGWRCWNSGSAVCDGVCGGCGLDWEDCICTQGADCHMGAESHHAAGHGGHGHHHGR